MYRSSSSTRVSDEFFSHQSSTTDTEQLLIYNPESEPAKKEKNRLRSAETAVHLIPLLLLLCAVILWFFSSPGNKLIAYLLDFTCFYFKIHSELRICVDSIAWYLSESLSYREGQVYLLKC